MKKKVLALITVVMMLATMLSGCNRVPTAEELVIKSIGNVQKTADMDLVMTIGMNAMMSGMSADLNLIMDVNVKTNEAISYMNGKIMMNLLGMEIAQDIESWSDLSSGTSYTYNSTYDCWISQTVEVPEVSAEDGVKAGIEIFKTLEMKEVADEDTEYVVTATVNLGDVYDLIGANLEDVLQAAQSVDLSKMNMNMTMKFDRNTEKLTTMILSADEASLAQLSMDGTVCTVLEVEATYHDVEELVLEIPATVLEEAVSADEMMELLQGWL